MAQPPIPAIAPRQKGGADIFDIQDMLDESGTSIKDPFTLPTGHPGLKSTNYRGGYRDLYEEAVQNPYPDHDISETGFTENMSAAFSTFVDEDLSISSFLNRGIYTERNKQLEQLRQTGIIPESVWEGNTIDAMPHGLGETSATGNTNFNDIVTWLRDQYPTEYADIADDDELKNMVRSTLKGRREVAQDIHRRAGGMGIAGTVVGTLGAALMDPLNVAGVFAVPYRAYMGMNVATRIATATAIGAGTEAVIQVPVSIYKDEIDSPYGAGDAIMNIAIGGAFGLTAESIGIGIGAAAKKLRATKTDDPDAVPAAEALETVEREMKDAPDPNMSAKDHASNIHQGLNELDEGRAQEIPTSRGLDVDDNNRVNEIYDQVIEQNPDATTLDGTRSQDALDEIDLLEENTGLEDVNAEISIDFEGARDRIKLETVHLQKLNNYIASYTGGDKTKLKRAIMSILVRDLRGDGKNVSIEARSDAIIGQAHAQLSDAIEKYRPKFLGFSTDVQGIKNMVRELFGEATNDIDAKNYASIWDSIAEKLRLRFNAAGGNIGKIEKWALPQSHNPLRVGKSSYAEWRAFTLPRLDRSKMMKKGSEVRDKKGKVTTPERTLDDSEVEELLESVYMSAKTDGLVKLQPGVRLAASSMRLADRHSQARYLHFRDGDSWLQYQEKYGSPDIYATITSHIDTMGHEISLLEVLGPDPDRMIDRLIDMAKVDTGDINAGKFIRSVYDNIAGNVYGTTRMGEISGSLRNIQSSIDLGSAPLSALSDPAFLAMTARFNGMSITRTFARLLGTLVPTRAADQQFATQLGLVAEHALARSISANRFSEVTGANWARRISDVSMRLSGLNALTQAGKRAFSMEFLANLSRFGDQEFGKLKPGIRRALERYGIDELDWDRIRKSKRKNLRGVKFIDPQSFGDDELTAKVVGMITSERGIAIPEPGARERAMLNLGTKQGTFTGEFIRAFGQYKAFPVTVLTTHVMRGLFVKGSINKGMYLGNLLVFTSVAGAIATQAKEISKGRDAMDWDDPSFWVKSMGQGGALGILGDFAFSDQTRYGRSPLGALAGPTIGRSAAAIQSLFGTAQRQLGVYGKPEKPSEIGADVLRTIEKQIPGSRLWYLRLALQRQVYDQINKLSDPKWHSKQSRMARRRRQETGQNSWWKPGKMAPTRAPSGVMPF